MLRYLSSLPSPTTFTSLITSSRTVDVDVCLHVSGKGDRNVRIRNVSVPVQYDELVRRLNTMGYYNRDPDVFFASNLHTVEITSGSSSFDFANGGNVNLDETLLHYYTNSFRPAAYPRTKKHTYNHTSSGSEIVQDHKIEVGGLVRIGFQRTLRTQDNKKVYGLPPDMGPFEVFNNADLADNLPPSVASKGGVCIAMYQSEAMWISFYPIKPCAVKVSIGGINALTGAPFDDSIPGRQDYIALSNDRSRQLWVDGVAVAPCVTRQVVAVPLGHAQTVKDQVTAHETWSDIQFDVYPLYPMDDRFKHGDVDLDIFKTPRQLGLSTDECIVMENLGIPPTILSPTHKSFKPATGSITLPLKANLEPAIPPGSYVVVTLTGKNFILSLEPHDKVGKIRDIIHAKDGIPPEQQLLMYGGRELEDDHTLSDYDIQPGSKIFLRLRARSSKSQTSGGLGAGVRISQKITNDPLPVAAYDFEKPSRLNVAVINASHFTRITGLPTPPTPVNEKTYEKNKYTWLEMYNESLSVEDNPPTPHDPVSPKFEPKDSGLQAKSMTSGCACCLQETASVELLPCGHRVCAGCLCVPTCPDCGGRVQGRKTFSIVGVDSGVYDTVNKRIDRLRRNRGTRRVTSFILKEDCISPLTSGQTRGHLKVK